MLYLGFKNIKTMTRKQAKRKLKRINLRLDTGVLARLEEEGSPLALKILEEKLRLEKLLESDGNFKT